MDHLLSKEKAAFRRDAEGKLDLLFNFQGSPGVPWEQGGVAQMGEHLPCKQGVKGSNPFISIVEFSTYAP